MSGHSGYFSALNALLSRVGCGTPRLVVDLDRADRNIARLMELQAPGSIRIVAKSLPCPDLLAHIFRKTGHEQLMVFHLPFLLRLIERFPKSDILMGKPLPIAAMRSFYKQRISNAFDDSEQLQWLVDTDRRLRQVARLAREIKRRISVSIELDVGMHRGGARSQKQLATLLDTIREHQADIRLAGFMGYDAHVPKAPFPRKVSSAASRVRQRYGDFLEFAWLQYSDLEEQEWCANGAGSPTIAMHGESSPLNDVSVGSLLLKPSGFDLPTLDEFEAAVWIAAPVLKRLKGVRIPFIEKMPSRHRDTLFIYGGKWMADPESPEGLKEQQMYGLSSNQQMLTVPSDSKIGVDDYVFLRPTQSEAVLLQFGDLCIVSNGEVHGDWPTL